MLAMGFVSQGKFACAIKVELKNFRKSYSSLCCPISDFFSLHPLRFHAFVVTLSAMFAMGFVGQEKVESAIRG